MYNIKIKLGVQIMACLVIFGLTSMSMVPITYCIKVADEQIPVLSGHLEHQNNEVSRLYEKERTMIRLKAINFDTKKGEPILPAHLKLSRYPAEIDGYYIVQFNEATKNEWLQQISNANGKVYGYIPNNAFVVKMSEATKTEVEKMKFVQWVGLYQPAYKLSPKLSNVTGDIELTCLFYSSKDMSGVISTVEKLGGKILSKSCFGCYEKITISTAASKIADIALMNELHWVEPYIKPQLFDEVSSEIVGGNWTANMPWDGSGSYVNSRGYNGSGVVVTVVDTGLDKGVISDMHPDVAGRVLSLIDYTETDTSDGLAEDRYGHGTHCTGIIAGNGAAGSKDANGYLYGMGVAPAASIIHQRVFSDADLWEGPTNAVLTKDAVQNGAYVSSNSWGMNTYGDYIIDDAEFDALTRDADPTTGGDRPLVLEFSAGNAGEAYGTIGSPACAKNVIATGATETYRTSQGLMADNVNSVIYFSSRGPCEDGRIKPDLVAPGTWLASLRSRGNTGSSNLYGFIDSYYEWCSGTSQSGPHVSGGAAIVVQYFKKRDNVTPSPALVKAVLINSADDIGYGFPSNIQGWGRMNLTNVVSPCGLRFYDDQKYPLTTGDKQCYQLTVGANSQPLKITLVWTDPPGDPAAAKALVNDLNLRVTAPDGTTGYKGNQFIPSTCWSNSLGSSYDSVNNVENVYIKTPQTGVYTIEVFGTSINVDAVSTTPNIDQDFAIVATGDLRFDVGQIGLDKSMYKIGDVVSVSLFDSNLTGSSNQNVKINSTTDPTGEILTLVERPANTGKFNGTIILVSSVPGAGEVQVSHGDIINISYTDLFPIGIRYDTAVVDALSPQISSVRVVNVTDTTARIVWMTNEDSTSLVNYGTTAALGSVKSSTATTTTHSITLTGLSNNTKYYFEVRSTDVVGNIRIDNRSGAYYNFTTETLITTHYLDNMETQTGWTNSTGWEWGTPSLVGPSSAHSGSKCWGTGIKSNYTNELNIFLISPIYNLTQVKNNAKMTFYHWYNTEYGYDGGHVEITTNGGGAWSVIIPIDGYDGSIPTMQDCSFVYTGDKSSLGWHQETFDLTPFIGNEIQIRFHFVSDTYMFAPGWYIDDLIIGSTTQSYGTVLLNETKYRQDAIAGVSVIDSDLNANLSLVESVNVKVTSTTEPTPETIILTEIDTNNSVFTGTISLKAGTPTPNGILEVAHGDIVAVTYYDASPTGIKNATAIVDNVPPVISNILVSELQPYSATITWATDEPATGIINYGTTVSLGHTGIIEKYERTHSFTITELRKGTQYYFEIRSLDEAGNLVTDNNGTNYYRFTTTNPYIILVDDDDGNLHEADFEYALTANGYNYFYWQISSQGTPPLNILKDFDIAIWFTSNDYDTTLTDSEQILLKKYLDDTGYLFITGLDIGYNIGTPGVGETPGAFICDYLHTDYIGDDPDTNIINGVAGDPITNGLTGLTFAETYPSYPTKIAPYDSYASTIFTYPSGSTAAIKVNTGVYKVVFFAFNYFEGADTAENKKTVMQRVIGWFASAPKIKHTPLKDTENTVSPYEVTATIVDIDNKLDTSNIFTKYSTNGVSYTQLSMAPTGNLNEYSCAIPKQSSGTTVYYYIKAKDLDNNAATHPLGANEGDKTTMHSFYVGADTTKPVIIHTQLSDTSDMSGYPVVATITDNAVLNTSALYVYYKTSKQPVYVQVRMSATGNPDEYSASIPKQILNTTINYYINATDSASTPNTAKSPTTGTYVFTIMYIPSILLVDDEDDTTLTGVFATALGDAGYTYNFYDIEAMGGVLPDLTGYGVVIWDRGNEWYPEFSSDRQNLLINHLDKGGGLYMSAVDLGYDIGSNGVAFYDTYLHAQYVADASYASSTNGVSGDAISDGFVSIPLTSDYSSLDGINARSGADVIFKDAADTDKLGVKYNSGTYKTVYTSFSLAQFGNASNRATLIDRLVKWLTPTRKKDVGVWSINSPNDSETYSLGSHSINATILNYGQNQQTNFNVSCEIKEIVSPSQTIDIFSDNMESGLQKWTVAPSFKWATSADYALSGMYSAHALYDNDANYSLTSKNIDLSTAPPQVKFEYSFRGSSESSCDYLCVEIKNVTDALWTQLSAKAGNIYENSWYKDSYNISMYVGKIVQTRFRFYSDSSVTNGIGWYIDDVIVSGITPELGNTVFGPTKKTITSTLNQYDTQFVNWSYSFANTSEYRIIVKTELSSDEKPDNDIITYKIKITGETITISLGRGWNLITLSLSTSYARAEDLAQAINYCKYIKKWNATAQSFEIHEKDTNEYNFTIENGAGYFVYVEQDTTLTYKGSKLLSAEPALKKGWNSIGWFNNISTNAETLGKSIKNCTAVAYWDNILCRFVIHSVGTNISNFEVKTGKGYFVYVASESTWTQ